MEKEIIFSFESILNFIDKCNKLNHELIKKIDIMGNISIPNQFEFLKRVKTYHYKKRTLEFFENRINFITDCINKNVSGLDILGNLLRGLIEIYCRVLYLPKITEEERIKKLVWHDLYSSLLIDIQFSHLSYQIIKDDYKLLKYINASIPPLQDLKKTIQDSLKKLKTKKQLYELEKEYRFKSVKQIIKKYFDENEKPPISKYTLYKIYSLYSEQIHSNLIIEVGDTILSKENKECSKYNIIAFSIVIYIKHLNEIAKQINENNKAERLINEFEDRDFAQAFLDLWKMHKYVLRFT
ncbi:hypothetical protein GF327_05410 [Candidatus Woesearchaeota archaeon]|nr:hypothetical protein [Candidatus Woesearchaeota archaeon]